MNRSRSLPVVLALVLACIAPPAASAAYGDLDADFGVNGKLADVKLSNPAALRIQSDRKILVAGRATSGNYDGRIIRLTRDGSTDTSFGTNGVVATPDAFIFDLELLADNRIIVLTSGNKLLAYRPDGSLDSGFGTGGILEFGDTPTSFKAASIGTQAGSKLLVSGAYKDSPTLRLLRLDGQGNTDASFANAGVATVPEGISGGVGGSAIATTPDGDILLGLGFTASAKFTYGAFAVAKFTEDGTRVTQFGGNGIASDTTRKDKDQGPGPREIVVSRDGGFVATSKIFNSGNGKSQGWFTFDWSFYRADGALKSGFPNRWAAHGAAPVDGPGLATSANSRVSVFTTDLLLNSKFGRAGSNTVTVGKCSDWDLLATDVDGSIVGAGSCVTAPNLSSQMVRFLGPSGGRAAPQVNITGSAYSHKFRGKTTTTSWLRVLTGTAGPEGGVRRVSVAVQRIDWPLPEADTCGWMIKHATKFLHRTDCDKPVFMPASGRSRWRFDFGRPLARGKYEIYVRATLSDGRVSTFNQDADSFRVLKVAKRARTK